MLNPTVPAVTSQDRVAAIAYSLWLEEGRPDGRAESHWFKALQQVNGEAVAPPVSAADQPKRKTAAVAAKKAAPRKRS